MKSSHETSAAVPMSRAADARRVARALDEVLIGRGMEDIVSG
jgi:hypothetical protein